MMRRRGLASGGPAATACPMDRGGGPGGGAGGGDGEEAEVDGGVADGVEGARAGASSASWQRRV